MRARQFVGSVFACALAWPLAAQSSPANLRARADSIVAVRQSDGSVVFTNLPGAGVPAPAPVRAQPPTATIQPAPRHLVAPRRAAPIRQRRAPSILAMLAAAARRYRLDPRLVREVAWQESGFDPRSVSDKGALGVMQLMPETARVLGVSDPFDPRQNIDGGARYLRDLLRHYRGNIRLSLAAYNAGPSAVARYGNRVPPFSETRDYVRVITRRLRSDGVRFASLAPRAQPIVFAGRDSGGALVYTDVR